MQNKLLWAILPMALFIAGCSSTPKEQKDEAEAAYIEQKTETIEEYKECVKDAGTDEAQLNACERLLKSVEGLAPAE